MPTGDSKVNIYDKKLMPQEAWSTYFFMYLNKKIDDTTQATFLSKGVLDDLDIQLTGPGNDQVGVDLTDAERGIDGGGHIMDLSKFSPTSDLDTYFENEVAIDYWIGFKYASVPNGIQNNPRSKEPEYPYLKDTIGELANPDSVTDNGTYIRLIVTGMLESGVDHSRRVVTVYLDNPVSPTDSIAFYTGTVEYSAPDNYIDIPYTGTFGPLGQTDPTFPISTTNTAYWVHVEGLSWFRNYDIRPDNDYVVIGKATGSGIGTTPSTFDLGDQVKTFLISLQRAYYGNSLDTPAPGRTIIADRGSVVIKQSASTLREYDDSNTGTMFDGLDQDDVAYQFPWMVFLNEDADLSSTYAAARNLANGVELLTSEAMTLGAGTNTVTLTRGAVDLTAFENDFLGTSNNITFVLLENTANDQDGLYILDSSTVAAGSVDVVNLDGSSPSWTADTGVARVMVLTESTIAGDFHGTGSNEDNGAIYHRFPRDSTGLDLAMLGEPNDESVQAFARIGYTASISTINNYFMNVLKGSIVMRGGDAQNLVYQDHGSWKVRGHAHYLSDKASGTGDWATDESASEWGYDYRGSDFGLESATDDPPMQWAHTARIPFWKYDGGNEQVAPWEQVTQLNATTFTLTRVGVDLTYLPCDVTGAIGGLVVEVEYDTPNSTDGIYVTYDTPSTSTLELRRLNGDSPVFPAGDAEIRIWGGVITGPSLGGQPGLSDSWMQTIVPPTPNCGGLRAMHSSGEDWSTTDWRWLFYASDGAEPMFGVRDGGVTFGRSITTKAPTSGHGITQWDQMVTSLLHADVVDLGITDSRKITLSATEANIDYIAPRTSTWSVDFTIPIHAGNLDQTGAGTHLAACVTDGSYLDLVYPGSTGGLTAYYAIDFKVQHGATINNVAIYANPANVTGANALGIRTVKNSSLTASASVDLDATGWVYATGTIGVDQLVVQVCDQNNTDVDNEGESYRLIIKSSESAAGVTHDYIYAAKVNVTISQLGKHMLYR